MRDFNQVDRAKKRGRIVLPDNPDQLAPEALETLGSTVAASARDAHLPCPAAWKIAKQAGVSRLAVGVLIDRLGIRVTQCQLGCFGVSKTPRDEIADAGFSDTAAGRVETLHQQGELTCANVFALAGELNEKPLAVAAAANVRGYHLKQCQLGCF